MNAEPEAPAAPGGGKASHPDPGALRFRVLRRGPWRRAFRLEEVFWEALEEAAAERNLKLTDHVRSLVEADGVGDTNASSVLRVHAAAFLRERIARLEVARHQREILHGALAAPIPCFVISATRALVSFNGEFSSYVIGRAQAASAEDVSKARLSLDVAVDRLIELLASQPGRVVICGFTIRTSAAIAAGRARVTLAQPSRNDLLVGYILAG